jgi:hypothetical protein
MLRASVAILWLLCAASVHAGTVDIVVRGANGQPLADAVVMIDSPGRKDAASRFPGPYRMMQKDIQFSPRTLIVPVGASVSFPNMDKARHHVYSFSSINRFELKLYGREENRTVTFPKAGVAALGCNIHDAMSAYVVVVDTPFTEKTDASGRVSIPGVPAGRGTLRVWHANIRAAGQHSTQPLAIPVGAFAQTVLVPAR